MKINVEYYNQASLDFFTAVKYRGISNSHNTYELGKAQVTASLPKPPVLAPLLSQLTGVKKRQKRVCRQYKPSAHSFFYNVDEVVKI